MDNSVKRELLASVKCGESFMESISKLAKRKSNPYSPFGNGHTDLHSDQLHKLMIELDSAVTAIRRELAASPDPETHVLITWTGKVVRNVFLITCVWQLLNIAILMIVCNINPSVDKSSSLLVAYYFVLFLQVLNLLAVLGASARLTRQVKHHSISGWFLGQCFLSTVLAFMGLYMISFRLDPEGWKVQQLKDERSVIFVIKLFVQMLHLSASTATLCGTSTVIPLAWYNFILQSTQMLLSFVYFASILGKIIGSQPVVEFDSRKAQFSHSASVSSVSGISTSGNSENDGMKINESVEENASKPTPGFFT